VDRLVADPVLLGHRRDGGLVRLAEDLDHLLLGKPALAHVLSVGCGRGSTFKLTPVQFSAGRPPARSRDDYRLSVGPLATHASETTPYWAGFAARTAVVGCVLRPFRRTRRVRPSIASSLFS